MNPHEELIRILVMSCVPILAASMAIGIVLLFPKENK